jgi:hypothetical protein
MRRDFGVVAVRMVRVPDRWPLLDSAHLVVAVASHTCIIGSLTATGHLGRSENGAVSNLTDEFPCGRVAGFSSRHMVTLL